MKKIYLLLLLVLIILSCQKEDFSEISEEELMSTEQKFATARGLKINNKQDQDLDSLPILNQVLLKFEAERRTSNKSSFDNNFDFTVDKNHFRVIEKGAYKSFTFVADMPESQPNEIVNLVISQNGTDPIKAFLITYDLRSFKKTIENKIIYDGNHTFSYLHEYKRNSNMKISESCTPVNETWCSYGEDHLAGPACIEESLTDPDRLYQKQVGCVEEKQTYIDFEAEGEAGGGGGSGTGDLFPVGSAGSGGETTTGTTEGSETTGSTGTEEPEGGETGVAEPVDKIEGDLTSPLLPLPEDEDKIDASELDGKAECIYNSLNVSSSTFKNIIQNFDGDFPVSHLKFSINNLLPSGNYGITNSPENFWIEIEMSNTQLSKISDLGSATAFVHEIVHAEIYRKMLAAAQMGNLDPENMTSQQQVNYINSLRNDFPGIYDYYIDRYKPTWNHNMMAEHYIKIIADAIQQYDNFTQDRQVYEDIAWAGLRNLEDGTTSVAWNNLPDLEKQRILNNLSDYFFNGPSNCN